ncbi:phosphoribosylglycinamide formyltransferase [Helicobacter mesocricetorum]|uniref:phosphoribosylglycinamide formyltransferase n=1 Tax=Helicobacter mesocricetorum TaxID=87012 RepID=UPI000CF11958|nr:phosphoribosylglycinamide formyltransferase [Helicobacter mesocricetorum]
MSKRIAILFSGNGSNLEAIIKALHQKSFKSAGVFTQKEDFLISGIDKAYIQCQDSPKIEIVLALSNKSDAYGIQRAKALGIPTEVLESKAYVDRESFDKDLVKILKSLNIDLCVLAGFMRVLTPYFVQSIPCINIHPSLLPLFKGAKGIEESFNAPMQLGGVSVHYVSNELDSGELIAQGVLIKQKQESLESYTQRIHALEHFLYPLAILKVLYGD